MRPLPQLTKKQLKKLVVESEPMVEDYDESEREETIEEEKDRVDAYPYQSVPIIDVASVQARIRKLTKASTFEPEVQYWLDTGFSDLNAVYGSREQGIPYGKVFETAGKKHGGKTALVTILAGLAQKDGAAVIYGDLENSRDPGWAGKLGLNFDQVIPIYVKMVQEKVSREDKKKQKESAEKPLPRLQGSEEIFDEIETAMGINYQMGFKKQFVIFDSIANIQTLLAIQAGATDRNMRVNVDRAQFLSNNLPRWASLAYNYNAQIHFINQLRTKPGVAFGDPNYTPGGNAVPFTASIQVRVGRIKNGKVTQAGKIIGIQGWMRNEKNKAGGGSLEGEEAAFKIKWNKALAKVEIVPREDIDEG